MPLNRFHKAAKDGKIDILKEATKRDCNARDEQGFTPTLYAAFHGNLEALRLLCGRGGDPNKADMFGNTALHLAAGQGHKHIVTFLVNFGANIYPTDIDGRTAQELAGMNSRDDILLFLDGVHAKLEAGDKKKTKALKDKAKKVSEKRVKEFNKIQEKTEHAQEKLEKQKIKGHRLSIIDTLKIKKSGSVSNLTALGQQATRISFSAKIGNGSISKNVRKVLASRASIAGLENAFKVSQMEDGKRSITPVVGIRRDSEVLYTNTIDKKRGLKNEVEDVDSSPASFSSNNGLVRSVSQPDFAYETNNDRNYLQSPGILVRPGIGSIAFRRSYRNTFNSEEKTYNKNSLRSVEGNGLRILSTEDEFSDSESSGSCGSLFN